MLNLTRVLALSIAYLLQFNFAQANDIDDCVSTLEDNKRLVACDRVVLNKKQKQETRATALISRGTILVNQKRYDEAIADYTTGLKLQKIKQPVTYFLRGMAHYWKRDFDNAIADYTTANNLAPGYHDAFTWRASSYAETKQYQKSIDDYSQALKIEQRQAIYLNRGEAYWLAGQNEAAVADFSQSISMKPNDGDAHYRRGKAYLSANNLDKAIDDFSEAMRIDPANAHYVGYRRYAHTLKGEYAKAIADGTEALRLDPTSNIELSERGRNYTNAGEFEKAIADLNIALQTNPNNALALMGRAIAFSRTKQAKQALVDFDAIQIIDPNFASQNVNYNLEKSFSHYDLGEADKALAEANESVRLHPTHEPNFANRGFLFIGRKEWQAAIADLTEAIRLNPSVAINYNNRSSAYKNLKDYQAAIKDADEAIRLKPDLANAFRHRAEAKAALNDLAGAEADKKRAIELNPEYASLINFEELFANNDTSSKLAKPDNTTAVVANDQLPPQQLIQPQEPQKPAIPLGRRVALIIGNGAYPEDLALRNPVNDANALAESLKRLGFEIVLETDSDLKKMNDARYRFAVLAEGADAAVVFYAGHGMQVNNVNYLMPIDATLESSADLKHKFITADMLLDDLATVKGMRMMILDACRDNPLSRSLKRKVSAAGTRNLDTKAGLADMKAEGVLIAFATQPNDVAADGQGTVNSPFTTALLNHLEEPNVEIDLMFKRVRTTVSKTTNGDQLPQTVNSSVGEFYMKPN